MSDSEPQSQGLTEPRVDTARRALNMVRARRQLETNPQAFVDLALELNGANTLVYLLTIQGLADLVNRMIDQLVDDVTPEQFLYDVEAGLDLAALDPDLSGLHDNT